MIEKDVTDGVCHWLEDRQWVVVSRHYPGAPGGLYFHSSKRTEKGSAGSIVPDIVARRGDLILFCESKVRYTVVDVRKVVRLLGVNYRTSIRQTLELNGGETLFGAVCFADTGLSHIRLGRRMSALRVRDGAVLVGGRLNQQEGESVWGQDFPNLDVNIGALES